ncbi:carboxypeptidase-like regulatory domain-containing protein [Xanthovirga aplysinae]|uniref:carboxypeptidase-like regulatory domain-containing protein n=1 Tax=Xanthovirga aplysinae TaxID=2529853 RepID=UPI0012BCC459|nr:carboxypeptidase-like regulatory domain-containing protein [Xanthovirga aplysinae]MTI31412.1 hypothetical protein [Xanthovirga aplysinae]
MKNIRLLLILLPAVFVFISCESKDLVEPINPIKSLVTKYESNSQLIPGVITGTVTCKEDGMPLARASVVIKKLSEGVQTDVDGKYFIRIPLDEVSVLMFSYIGKETMEVKVSMDTRVVDVALAGQIINFTEKHKHFTDIPKNQFISN